MDHSKLISACQKVLAGRVAEIEGREGSKVSKTVLTPREPLAARRTGAVPQKWRLLRANVVVTPRGRVRFCFVNLLMVMSAVASRVLSFVPFFIQNPNGVFSCINGQKGSNAGAEIYIVPSWNQKSNALGLLCENCCTSLNRTSREKTRPQHDRPLPSHFPAQSGYVNGRPWALVPFWDRVRLLEFCWWGGSMSRRTLWKRAQLLLAFSVDRKTNLRHLALREAFLVPVSPPVRFEGGENCVFLNGRFVTNFGRLALSTALPYGFTFFWRPPARACRRP